MRGLMVIVGILLLGGCSSFGKFFEAKWEGSSEVPTMPSASPEQREMRRQAARLSVDALKDLWEETETEVARLGLLVSDTLSRDLGHPSRVLPLEDERVQDFLMGYERELENIRALRDHWEDAIEALSREPAEKGFSLSSPFLGWRELASILLGSGGALALLWRKIKILRGQFAQVVLGNEKMLGQMDKESKEKAKTLLGSTQSNETSVEVYKVKKGVS